MNRTIRPAVADDRMAVEALVMAAYGPFVQRNGRTPGPMLDDYAALIAAGHVNVLEHDGAICGVAVLVPEPDTMLLENVAVSPDVKGKGFGKLLLQFAEQAAIARGYRSIRLYTQDIMTENIALYGRIGYRETHRAEEQGLNRVFMTKALG